MCRRLPVFLAAVLLAASSLAVVGAARAVTPNGRLQIIHLDVAQGDGAVIISPLGQVVMIDEGKTAIVPPQIQALGVTHVDHHFVSHYHDDHLGNFPKIFGSVGLDYGWDRGGSYSTGAYANYVGALGARRRTLVKNQIITLDSLSAHPVIIKCVDLNRSSDENNASVVLKVTYGEYDEVFGGDLQSSGESVVGPEVGPVEVYKVHHHGSATSSTASWLNATQPKLGVISVGSNSYGHPTADALSRLHAAGVHTYWTEVGAGVGPDPNWDRVSSGQVIISATWQPGAVDTIRGNGFADTFTNSGTASDITPPLVAVASPDGGEDWKAGSSHSIAWTATDDVGVSAVDLAYSTDGGASFPNAIATGLANAGSHPWTVPNAPGSTVRVRVTAHDEAGNLTADSSATDFTISTWTIVASASAGGNVVPSGVVPVVEGASQHFSIAPAAENQISGVDVDGAPATPDTAYTFGNVTANHTLTVTFADMTGPVVHVTSPVGGERWDAGTQHAVTWTAGDEGGVDSVSVDYSLTGAPGPWLPVAHGLANSGSCLWTLPEQTSDYAVVRVTAFDPSLNQGSDTSDDPFHVTTAGTAGAIASVHDLDVTLRPGVWLGWALQSSCAPGGFAADITPLSPGTPGLTLARFAIQPEYEDSDRPAGHAWWDALRMQTPPDAPELQVNFRTYDASGLPVVAEFNSTLEPGVWHGFLLGPSSLNQGYLPKITPIGPNADGAHIERYVVEPEYDGSQWNDILRMKLGGGGLSAQPVNIRVYGTSSLPVAATFETTLQPGVWHGFELGASSLARAYLAEITPSGASSLDATIEKYVVEPEYSGTEWIDMLRVQIPDTIAALPVHIRVYAFEAPAPEFPASGCRAAGLAPGTVRTGEALNSLAVWYAVPSDIAVSPEVLARIKAATADIQAWYQCATGGRTWSLAFPDTVRVYQAAHDRLWYQNNGDWWGSLLPEMQAAGLPVWTTGTIGAVWAHGAGWWAGAAQDSAAACGMALLGVELFPEFNDPAYSGGTCPGGTGELAGPCTPEGAFAHELGHTLGLAHPSTSSRFQPVASHSVMQSYWNYPNWATEAERPWGFLTYDRQVMRASAFMHDGVALQQVHDDCDVVNLPDRCVAPEASFVSNPTGVPSRFSGTSTSAGGEALYWTFGDGVTASTIDVTHDYAEPGTYNVRLRAVGEFAMIDTASTIVNYSTVGVEPGLATRTELAPGAPNPFAGHTMLTYQLAHAAEIELSIYSVDGRRMRRLASGYRVAGSYTVKWDSHGIPPGVYLVRLRAGASTLTQRVVHLD